MTEMPKEDEHSEKSPRFLEELETTEDVKISTDPLERVIGQDEAVRLARIAAPSQPANGGDQGGPQSGEP